MLRVRSGLIALVALALAIGLTAVRATAEETKDKKETGTVSGVVQDKDGKPVAGAEVGVYNLMKHADKADKKAAKQAKVAGEKPAKPIAVVPVVKTDDKGEFTISDVPVGEYSLQAKLKGQGNAREKIEVKAGETAKVTLKLEYHAKGAGSAEKPADSK